MAEQHPDAGREALVDGHVQATALAVVDRVDGGLLVQQVLGNVRLVPRSRTETWSLAISVCLATGQILGILKESRGERLAGQYCGSHSAPSGGIFF